MGDFHLDSNFHASLHRILDDVALSIDECLEQVIAMLARWDPTLLIFRPMGGRGEIAQRPGGRG